MRKRWTFPALGLSVAAALSAGEPSREDLERWVRDLGGNAYQVREDASERLRQAGLPAKPFLEQALKSDDFEVRNRAREILDQLERLERIKDLGWLGVELAESIVGGEESPDALGDKPLRLGVSMADLNRFPGLADRVKVEKGIMISQVQPGSPAEKGGLKRWDIVTMFNGREVSQPEELRAAVQEAPAGKPVPIGVLRLTEEGRRREVQAVMGEPVKDPDALAPLPVPESR